MYKYLVLFLMLFTSHLFASTLDIPQIDTTNDDFTMWIALFGLGIISLFALFLSSEQVKTFRKNYEKKEQAEKKIQKSENELLAKMSENIYDIAKDKRSDSSETQLLTVTANLIEFLRIKSKKVTVVHEQLKISNLLNDVTGTLKSNAKNKELELFYKVDPNVSKNIFSDTLNLSKVLTNVLLYCIQSEAKHISLEIKTDSLASKDDQLFFTINSHLKIDVESGEDIFASKYNEETETYESLGLFIAKELARLMHGDLIARNNNERDLEFVFNIPYQMLESATPPKKVETTRKNILVIDLTPESSAHIASMLQHENHKVKVISQKEYIYDLPIFQEYDIIFLEESLFTDDVMIELQKIDTQIVATYNIFKKPQEYENSRIANLKVSKPLTVWQIQDILLQLDEDKQGQIIEAEKTVVNAGNCPVHRHSFQITRNVTLSKFIQFKNRKILLVEDNLINQKVFLGILGKSQMLIEVANNGQEALDILQRESDFDLIFMDINMPTMDGYTATKKIREVSRYDNIPIVALSALTSNDEISKMFSCGMNGYISKPLKKEILFTVFLIFIQNTTKPAAKEVNSDNNHLRQIDGLNIELGISKSAYNDIFYKEILVEFKDAYQTSDLKFEKLLQDFRYEQLRILCLDINGLSGTIGAEKLHEIITDIIKKIILKKYEIIPELLAQYKIELKRVNASIDKYLSL